MNRLSLWLVPALFLVGCAHTPPVEEKKDEPAPAPVAKPADAAPAAATGPKSCTSDGECGDGQLCIRSTCVDISKGLAECKDFRVQFGFNSVDFEPSAKADLDRMSRCLRADQSLRVTIEGNADERGTEEYNLQLGSKRASTVEKYLVALGVTAGQVNTISYGENMPVCRQQDEACWAKNRRAAVKPEAAATKTEPKKAEPKKK
jgi:peptidoglycan-associated lipoprotein